MLSKHKIGYIKSLDRKKVRKEEKVFLAEGPKLVGELADKFPCDLLVATPEWMERKLPVDACEVIVVTPEELTRASLLKTPQQVLGIFRQPEHSMDCEHIRSSLSLALDDVRDPGNLGTIIRIADWFGIENVFCTTGTADVYNPKAVQATMGGIARVKVHYLPLKEFIRSLPGIPVYGTFMDGENLYGAPLSPHGIIIMGNEGNGISAEIKEVISRELFIPSFPPGRETSESLNVAVATALVCGEFRRRGFQGINL